MKYQLIDMVKDEQENQVTVNCYQYTTEEMLEFAGSGRKVNVSAVVCDDAHLKFSLTTPLIVDESEHFIAWRVPPNSLANRQFTEYWTVVDLIPTKDPDSFVLGRSLPSTLMITESPLSELLGVAFEKMFEV